MASKPTVTIGDNGALPNPDKEHKVNSLPGKTKEFVDKHTIKKINQLGDKGYEESQFTANSIKKDETKLASHKAGEDAEVYESTQVDLAKRERIVKGMKKGAADFKEKYGKRWKSVMYATATKAAMESVEQIDEISKSTLGSYATKALRSSNIAARMAHSDDDEMAKIANKREAGVKKAIEKIAPKKTATVGKIKANIDKAREAAKNRYTDKDDQGKSYHAAQKGIAKIREEAEELDEVNIMRPKSPAQEKKTKDARMAAALIKDKFKRDHAAAAKEKSLAREETETDLLNKLFASLTESNRKLMNVMLEDGRTEELLEFALEQFNDDV